MGYLIIGRKYGERILIGDDIEILISGIDYDEKKVDIAIKAPKDVYIGRLGTLMEVEKEKKKNASIRPRHNTRR